MLNVAANLTFMFTETPFMQRFARAAAAGFRFVEFHNPFPYSVDVAAVSAEAQRHNLTIIHCNLPAGDWNNGDRGIAAWPDRITDFRASVETAIVAAQQMGCRQLNCPVGYARDAFTLDEQQQTLIGNLRWAAGQLAQEGILLLIEPLNPITHPGYLLINTAQAVVLQDAVNHPNLKIQYDYYQMQRSEGELALTVEANIGRIGFVQLADNPGRCQPGLGEINYPFLLKRLAALPYDGFVSLEYAPVGSTEESLGWLIECGLRL